VGCGLIGFGVVLGNLEFRTFEGSWGSRQPPAA